MQIPLGKCFLISIVLTALLAGPTHHGYADAPAQLSEPQAKAIFVYNIIRYVAWPKIVFNSEETVEVGILTKTVRDSSWDILKGKSILGRRVVIRSSSDIDDLRACQIIYFDASIRKDFTRSLNLIKQEPILTVSDIDNFHAFEGGMIAIKMVNSKLTFSINLATARRSSLHISSHLLKLAQEVLQ